MGQNKDNLPQLMGIRKENLVAFLSRQICHETIDKNCLFGFQAVSHY